MCQSNNWKRLEAKPIEGDSFHFLLRGIRSDGVIVQKNIKVAQVTGNSMKALPGLLDNLINEINKFESCRNGELDAS